VILLAAIGLVGLEVYEVWQKQAPILEDASALQSSAAERRALLKRRASPNVSTRTIVARNLFDPDRGVKVEEPPEPEEVEEEEPQQSIEGLLLLGTVIAGSDRYAIMHVPPDLGALSANQRRRRAVRRRQTRARTDAKVRRVRVGDSLRGYQVTDIDEQKVVLARGEAQAELRIDYTREVVTPKTAAVKKRTPTSRKRSARRRQLRNRQLRNRQSR